MMSSKKKSVFQLNENVAGALSYVFLFFSGLFFLVAERENKFVRFHALQSVIWFLVLGVIATVTGWLPILKHLIPWAANMLIFVSWVFLTLSALKGKTVRIPILGDVVWEKINR